MLNNKLKVFLVGVITHDVINDWQRGPADSGVWVGTEMRASADWLLHRLWLQMTSAAQADSPRVWDILASFTLGWTEWKKVITFVLLCRSTLLSSFSFFFSSFFFSRSFCCEQRGDAEKTCRAYSINLFWQHLRTQTCIKVMKYDTYSFTYMHWTLVLVNTIPNEFINCSLNSIISR